MSAQLFYLPFNPVFNSTGLPAGAAKAFFYYTGTTTLAPVYSDSGLTQRLSQPVLANALGGLPTIYMDSAITYRVRITDTRGGILGNDIDSYVPGTARKGDKGETGGGPGGSVGPFSAINGITVAAGVNSFLVDDGGFMLLDMSMTDANVAAYPLAIVKDRAGRYFRRDPRAMFLEQFGAVGDAVLNANGVYVSGTDNTAAINAAIAYQAFTGKKDPLNSAALGGYTIFLGTGIFYTTGGHNIHSTVGFMGRGRGLEGGNGATAIVSPNTIFIVEKNGKPNNYYTTSGDGSSFEGLSLLYCGTSTAYGLTRECAIYAKARIRLKDCLVRSWPGPGVQIIATSGSGSSVTDGEASGCDITFNVFDGNWVGLWTVGGDSNLHWVNGNVFSASTTWGWLQQSFLCVLGGINHYKQNGLLYRGATSLVAYNNSHWQAAPGKEGVLGTTTPGTDATVWAFVETGIATALIPTWVSGGTYRSGGSLYCDNPNARSLMLCPYVESGQGSPIIMYPTMVIAGQMTLSPLSTAVHLTGEQGLATARGFNAMLIGVPTATQMLPDVGVVHTSPSYPNGIREGSYGTGVRRTYQGLDAFESWRRTGPNTTETFGRANPVPHVEAFPQIAIGGGIVGRTSGLPSDIGGVGEFRWNTPFAAGGVLGYAWTGPATSAGAWKSVGTIAS